MFALPGMLAEEGRRAPVGDAYHLEADVMRRDAWRIAANRVFRGFLVFERGHGVVQTHALWGDESS